MKKLLPFFTTFIFIFFSFQIECSGDLSAQSRPLADTEAEASTIIGGCVNVLTGTYVNTHNDCAVISAEPLTLMRNYAPRRSQDQGLQFSWRHNYESEAGCSYKYGSRIKDDEIEYRYWWQSTFISPSGNAAYFQELFPKLLKQVPFTYKRDLSENFNGLTNIGSGNISAQTNLKNLRNEIDRTNNICTIITGANHKYVLKTDLLIQKKKPSLKMGSDEYCHFLISEEKKPNGNRILYKYDDDLQLSEVKSINAAGNLEFGSLKFDRVTVKELKKKPFMTIKASDGKFVTYRFASHEFKKAIPKKQFYISEIERSDAPLEQYSYVENAQKIHSLLSQITHPEGRFISFDYYPEQDKNKWLQDKIREVKAPVGSDKTPITIYRFTYRKARPEHDGKTTVFDAYNHQTQYYFTTDSRLTTIKRFTGTNQHSLYSQERFFWGEKNSPNEANLLSHTLKGPHGGPLCCRSYIYDNRGNVLEEQLWGNLTGKGCPRIEMKASYPVENGCECYRVLRKYSEDGFNLLLEEIEPNGKKTTFKYIPNTNLLERKIVYAEPGTCLREFCHYDQNAILISKIHDNGTSDAEDDLTNVTQRLITHIAPQTSGGGIGLPSVTEECYLDLESQQEKLLKKTVLHYDRRAQVIQRDFYDNQNKLHCSSFLTYDDKGHLVKEENSIGQTVVYKYDANGNCVYSKGPNQNVEVFNTFDFSNRCTKTETNRVNEGIFVENFTYDYLGNLTSSTDIYGSKTSFTYNEFGKPIKIEHPSVEDPDGKIYTPIETCTYDLFGNKNSYTDSAGYTTNTLFTILGHPQEIQYPDGTIERFQYTIDGKLEKKTEKNGSYYLFTYDMLGRKVKEELHSADHSLLTAKQWVYDAFNLLSETDANENVTSYTYDGAGRKTSEIRGEAIISIAYDSLGRIHKTSQPCGNEISVQVKEYDKLNNVIEERIEDGLGTILRLKRFEYDLFGNCLKVIVFQEKDKPLITSTTYNTFNQPLVVRDPLGNLTHYSYNHQFVNQNGVKVLQKNSTDPKGIQTIETHNVRGKCASIEKKNQFGQLLSREQLKYDRNGNLACWIESAISEGKEKRKIVNRKQHGPLNRVEKVIEAEGTPEQKIVNHAYNAFGQLEKVLKPDGVQLCSSYDSQGRLALYSSTDNTISYEYAYDNNNNLLQIVDNVQNATTSREYDVHNRIQQEVLASGLSLSYDYDLLNRRTKTILPDQTSIEYRYNAAFLIEVQRCDKNHRKKYEHKYLERDLSGNALRLQHAGKAGFETRRYDALGRRTSTIAEQWKEIVPVDGYDAVGNLLKFTVHQGDEKQTYQFAYDDLQQIAQEDGCASHQYVHDSLSNRLERDKVACKSNALNQMVAQGECKFAYDANGNMVRQSNGDQVINYCYDALDRLIKVTKEKQLQVCYRYDHFNRRIDKQSFVWENGRWVKGKEQKFIYEDQNEIGAYEQGKLTQLRVLGEGLGAEIGSAVAMEISGKVSVPVHNMRGDICCVMDLNGQLVNTFCYSAFGECFGEEMLPWGFASKRYDEETGLVYFGRRYYSPDMGRWVTADPLGFADGPNLYAYVRNSPLTHFDLYGLFSWQKSMDYVQAACPLSCQLYGCKERTTYYPGRPAVVFCDSYMCGPLNAQPAFTTKVGDKQAPNIGFGFSGGINTSYETGMSNARYLSELSGGYQFDYVHNPSNGFVKDCCRYLNTALHGMATNVIPELHMNWDNFFDKNPNGWYLQIGYSEAGGNICCGLKSYHSERRERIFVIMIAPGKYVDRKYCGGVWHYTSRRDIVPWLDLKGWWRNRSTTYTLESHKDAKFNEHNFQSPTYRDKIDERIQEHLNRSN